ncbi:MAG: 50S ribosomal protein L4 [Clostridia bacterium]|nr:50S ribosomal protein L4 [Clostridia bacterium]MBR0228710.1 50S ribosomal protein L4 [Clostridia bacterium]
MPNIDVLDMQGKKVGSMELSEEVFAAPINVPAMHLVVRSILANKRQGTQSALTRGMVRGGGRKIYRQKGTGNARHHGNRAPQFRHGGVVFAPQPRDYVINVPKKVRRLAMKSALTSKLNEGAIVVVDQIKLADAKTKLMAQVIKALGAEDQKALLVLSGRDESVIRASKNIPTVKDAYVNTINVYDLLNADKIIVLKGAMQDIQEVYA